MISQVNNLNITRYIFWIDSNINNEENQNYLNQLNKEFPSHKIKTFTSILNLKLFLKREKNTYDFKFIYNIISGSLAENFFNTYNLFTHTTIIAATIVFCYNKSYHLSKPYANDLYLNPGGIVNNFSEVIKYIKTPNDLLWLNLTKIKKNSIILKKNNSSFGNTFKYAQSLSEIALPIILTEIIKKNLIQDLDILKFKSYIFSRYLSNKKNNIIIPLVKPSLEKSVYIPLKKRAKFLLRLYTAETDFYSDINKELTNIEGFGPYKVFILILYFSIQNKSLNSYTSTKLYRKTLISKNEMDEIIKIFQKKKNSINSTNEISSILYYGKPFMSFSKDRSIADNFAKNIYPNTVRVMFILNPPKYNEKIFFSNIDIDSLGISQYNEKEVLFLPLSCFEITDYKKIGNSDYEITLNYLDKYYDELNKKISSMKKQDTLQKFYEKVLESPFSEKVIECLEDYRNIFNNIKDFFQDRSTIENINLSFNKIIPKLPHEKLIPKFNENASMKGIPSGYSNGKQLNVLYKSEPVTIQLQEHKNTGYKIWELKYADGKKAIIRYNAKKGNNIIIKKIDENGQLGYYDEAFKPISKEIKIGNTNTKEVLKYSEGFNMTEVKQLSLLRNGFAEANLFGGAIGYNLANIDNFIKSSNDDKIKSLLSTLGLSTGMSILSKAATSAVPYVSAGLLGGFFIYDLISDIDNPALTKDETIISIIKNFSNLAVNVGVGIGGFIAGMKIGISLGITTGPGAIIIGFCSGIVGGVIGGLFGRLLNSDKMILNCNSFYKNYIPLKFREEGNIPDLFWDGVNKNTKSLALEVIIDQKYKTWSVINIPPQTRKISPNIGETLMKYSKFRHYSPNIVDFVLYSIKKEKITKEEWNDKKKNKELIIDVAILEVDNL